MSEREKLKKLWMLIFIEQIVTWSLNEMIPHSFVGFIVFMFAAFGLVGVIILMVATVMNRPISPLYDWLFGNFKLPWNYDGTNDFVD